MPVFMVVSVAMVVPFPAAGTMMIYYLFRHLACSMDFGGFLDENVPGDSIAQG